MKTIASIALAGVLCAGCGAETVTATATVAEIKKRELENARAMQAQIEQQMQANQQAQIDRMKAIEEAAR